jgi:putative membrane protein
MMIKRNFVMTAFVAVGLIASLEYASIAQSPSPTPTPTTPTSTPSPFSSPTPTPTTPTPTPSPFSSPTPTPTTPTNPGVRSSLSQFDKQFMVEAAQGGMAEVAFGKIATQKASSNVVKEYARRMVVEHTKANNELKALAKQKGVTLPTTIGKKNEELKQKLSKLSGAKFDQEYMKEAGLKSHTEQAQLFERQVARGQNPDVKSFAAKTLPVVQKHLQHAQDITGDRSNSSNRRPSSN